MRVFRPTVGVCPDFPSLFLLKLDDAFFLFVLFVDLDAFCEVCTAIARFMWHKTQLMNLWRFPESGN